MFADLVLITSPCSVTTTASDDEFSQQTLLGGTAAPTFLLSLVWRPCTGFFPNSPFARVVCAEVSFRPCRCRTCSSSMPQAPPTSTISLRSSGPWPLCGVQCSLQCPGLAGNEAHRTLNDPVGLTLQLAVSLAQSDSLLGGLVQSLSPIAGSLSHLGVTLLRPC